MYEKKRIVSSGQLQITFEWSAPWCNVCHQYKYYLLINTEKLASRVNKAVQYIYKIIYNTWTWPQQPNFLALSNIQSKASAQMVVGLLSLCLDHHKFSIKTNLRAFNSKRFTDRKAKDCKRLWPFRFSHWSERSTEREWEQKEERETRTTREIAIDLQLMSTTLHCIYILCITQLSLSLWLIVQFVLDPPKKCS